MQEELLLRICIGSLIIWWKPFDVLNEESFVLFAESISLDQQEVDIASKSPNVTETNDLWALISDRRCSKFVEKLSSSLLI